MMLNKLNNVLDKSEWQITIVDQHETHYASAGLSGHDHDAGRDLYACHFYEKAAGGQIIFT